ncbi:PREDICTED: FGGY carbohydrate kinase domain-containing protein [Nicrophorus vespilloides]|uniref:FGGY carbohydrate kinase domain-containing protein n=1 Tax=Nicrophorus vespilloides TaxID=110193 RepID=A0ABM1MRY3_NICVS|nr:PREDICTED: FGGY carbohydrate kinase domain-containing protein [Nicrophorus vespilloides]
MVYFVGVDVGTGSVRAALVDATGTIRKTSVKEIKIWNDLVDHYEQSSEDIWSCCVRCVKDVCKDVDPELIRGIGFDATCSLVAIDVNEEPLSISVSGRDEQNVMMWLDHRAQAEAKFVSGLKHDVLKYTGGSISLEMQTPKLLWLKKHLKEQWDKSRWFFDLPDFLTWKATGCDSRSLCSLVCKWTYNGRDSRWERSYFEQIGLEDLLLKDACKIGGNVNSPGKPIGDGLSRRAAEEFNLLPGTAVGASIIDAHAGGLALLGCSVANIDESFESRMALICGTSTCHMVVSEGPVYAAGIWGPYYGAMVPGLWLNEGGQSVTGKLVDHIIETHPATANIRRKLRDGQHVQHYLNSLLVTMAAEGNHDDICYLSEDIHVWPDFHGNRSPIADPTLKGAICGLTLSTTEKSLALLYLATLQALCYGTRHILESLKSSGNASIESILICGGLSRNDLFRRTQADVLGLPVVCPEEKESVLLGAAILGAAAAQHFPTIVEAMKMMGGKGIAAYPNDALKAYHDKKYRVFLKMLEHQNLYRSIMKT